MKARNIEFNTKVEALTMYIRTVSLLRGDSITPTDAYYLSLFLTLPPKYAPNPFSTPARKHVRKILNVTEGALNNRIYALLDNNYLYRDEDKIIYINPYFLNISKLHPIPLNVALHYEETSRPGSSGSPAIKDSSGDSR